MKVLLPTDFSENSKRAIDFAIEALAPLDCEFTLLNTYQSPQAGSTMIVNINEMLAKGSEEGLATMKAQLLAKHGSKLPELQTFSTYGSVFSGIQYCVEKLGTEMIAMGTKGETGLQRLILGSNTAYAIQHTEIPLLAIPQEAKSITIKNVLLAADQADADSDLVAPLKEMLEGWDAKLHVLHVVEPSGTGYTTGDTFGGIPCSHISRNHADIIACVDEEIENNQIDMGVVIAKHHGFLYRLFNRSVSQTLALHSHIPLLVLHD